MLKVETTVDVCERNDSEVRVGDNVSIRVLSHWNRSELVVLEVYGNRYTVNARELQAAVDNAVNTVRY